jgi:hypothetical protein
MSAPDEPEDSTQGQRGRQEVLSGLPRHRPQRLTARRRATRETAPAAKTAAEPKPASRKVSAAAPKQPQRRSTGSKRPARPRPARAIQETRTLAPKQGFAAEEAPIRGSVQPPNGTEMLVSALHLSGALGKGGLATGGRLLKGMLSRVPRP